MFVKTANLKLQKKNQTYRQIGNFENAKRTFEKLLALTKLKGLTGWESHACLGLANLESDTNNIDIEKVESYLAYANTTY